MQTNMFVLKRPITGTYFTIATKNTRSVLAFRNMKDAMVFHNFVKRYEDEAAREASSKPPKNHVEFYNPLRLLPKPKRNNSTEIYTVDMDHFVYTCSINSLNVAIYAQGDVQVVEKNIDKTAVMFNLESLYYY
jgi:hypothetical protein|uniref:Uncharacterized protein n=1 Tax=viral metagenome TaxID=1070528 RepID=A0A6C0BFY5_9ZZZZ